MKTAIVCDWLVHLGGAEKALSHFISCYPQADIYAVIDFVDKNQRDFLHNKTVHTTFIQQLPFAKKLYRHYLPFMPLAIEQLDLSAYELIISSSHAVAKGVITGPDQLHISYVHSPMRYAWDLQHQYLQESGLDKKWRGYLARYLLHKMRLWDSGSSNGVDHFAANSHFIASRIQKYYRRQATVIYPAVNTTDFTPYDKKENFYLTASRFVPYKRIDLIVESFAAMPDKRLLVIGDGPDRAKIEKKASKNVEILGYVSNERLIYFMQRAKAFIFAAEEDFGLVPVEAQSCGTPVIAYGKGGTLETVRDLSLDQPTGIFFTQQNSDALCKAIHTFEEEQHRFTVAHCVANALRFAPIHFKNNFTKFVQEKIDMRQKVVTIHG